mmetsp:Transcript_30357/g.59444  ORF Transcript_30357/g.59444 Transcript_30357/m.59444 type:complete len:184 (-) Transcript_30357:289-840(-)
MRINCRLLNGSICSVVVPDLGCTVMRLKCNIAQRLKARLQGVWTMKLYNVSNMEMQDAKSLSSYGIINNSSVTLVLKMAKNIRIKAIGPGGECFLTLPSISTVAHLKEIYERRCSADCKTCSLQVEFKGKKVPNHSSLSQAGINNGMQVTVRRIEGPKTNENGLSRGLHSKKNLLKALKTLQI